MDNTLMNELFNDIFSVIPVFSKVILNVGDILLKENGIARAHIIVIYCIKNQEKINITELSKILSAPKPNVTCWVEKLVKIGFAERAFDEADRRIIYVKLTEEGLKFVQIYEEELRKSFALKLGKADSKDIELLKDTLENMKKLLIKIN